MAPSRSRDATGSPADGFGVLEDWDDLLRPLVAHLIEAKTLQKSTMSPKGLGVSENTSARHGEAKNEAPAPKSSVLNPTAGLCQVKEAAGLAPQRSVSDTQSFDMMRGLQIQDSSSKGYRRPTGTNAVPLQQRRLADTSTTDQQDQPTIPEQLRQYTRDIEKLFNIYLTQLSNRLGQELSNINVGGVASRLPKHFDASKREFTDNLWKLAAKVWNPPAEAQGSNDHQHDAVPTVPRSNAATTDEVPTIHNP
jgi:hypothetical protein